MQGGRGGLAASQPSMAMATPRTQVSAPAVVIDHGAYTTQVGLAGQPRPTRTMPTAVARTGDSRKYVGDAIDGVQDPSQLHFRRPFDRGYLMNWDVTQELWDRAFGKDVLAIKDFGGRSLVVTEPLFNHEPLQDTMDELVFELYGFRDYYTTSSPVLSSFAYQCTAEGAGAVASIVVDSGYSFTHSVPIFDGTKVNYAVKRLDVGGKLLTNYMKELVTYREASGPPARVCSPVAQAVQMACRSHRGRAHHRWYHGVSPGTDGRRISHAGGWIVLTVQHDGGNLPGRQD
jgi:actin-related protein